ncbi:MAG: hypothetical protein JRJ47_15135, partial [Deltaproteobacteria bacterium]|nr:hypothetical protein [Deltaproteobacteria bacterium]
YVPTRVFHIAMGGIYAAIPFIAMACLSLGLHFSVAIVVAVIAGVLLSILCEGFNHYPLEKRGACSHLRRKRSSFELSST